MLIIQRYYLKEFLKVLTIVAAGLAFIFSILELIDKIDDFLPYSPSLKTLLFYILFSFPRYLLYLLPMAALLCSLFVFSRAKRKEEITAIKAAGGRIKTLFLPFVFGGLLLSIFGFILGEFVVPEFSKKTIAVKESITKKGKKFSFKEGTIWLRATNGSIVKIGLYLPEKKISMNISIFKIEDGRLRERIEALEAEWLEINGSNGQWKLRNVILYNVENGSVSRYKEMEYPFVKSLDFFSEGIQKPQDMGIRELYRYTKKLEEAGFKNLKLIVDLNAKVSYPLINFFMVLLGISLAVKGRTGGGLVTTAIGIFISLLYWFGHVLSLSLGYAGILPAVIATWLVPVMFGIIAINLFVRIPE
ncbi:MAG: LptF/LptG family permease [Nitrospirae bacterium]|nr:LptF/LptG family permease [Nitrospirota bacterium]